MRPIVFALLLPLAACGNGSDDGPGIPATGTGAARSFAATDFTAIDLRGPDDIDVRVGAGYSVRAEGDQTALDKLKIDKDGDTLRIGRTGMSWGGSSGKARIFITMPRIAGAGVSGSGNLSVDRADGSKFDGGVAGSGNLKIAAMAVDKAELSIAGSGNVTAAGTARALELSIAGSGNIDARNVVAQEGEASIAGSGDIAATINGPAKVSLMGSGDIDLGAKARCTTDKMGSGSVRCGN